MGCGTIAALALTGAGTGVNMLAGERVRNNMNSLVGQEMARNADFTRQAQSVANQSLAQSTPQAANQQIGQGQQQLAGLIQNAQSVPLSASSPSFGNVNTMAENAKTQMSNKAASQLGGYSNFGLQQYLKDLEAQNQLGVISNNARGWAGILPAQLQQAQGSEQGLQALGSLLNTGGMLTGLSGLARAPLVAPSSAQWNAFNMGFGPVSPIFQIPTI